VLQNVKFKNANLYARLFSTIFYGERHVVSGMSSIKLPIALATAALSLGFNYNLAEWGANLKELRKTDNFRLIRSAEEAKHGYLLSSGAICLAAGTTTSALSSIRCGGRMACAGVAWGGAGTLLSAVFNEWDNYDDGRKAVITGGSLIGVIAAAMAF